MDQTLQGVLTHVTGNVYEGTFVDGYLHGKGKLLIPRWIF